ncbi:Na+:H+ antiporter, NhaC family [Alkalithermobacter thermoalcaliphilus JW-YL-7 = DSM 7308]|uniref:Na+/H+ antiporter NhaC n=1 Tax=Alkalithermobacter thermoalcaliphilus JW-YL-7 = DSM 7308 TaxID=1121328 RepID=A0A150FT56_CLOPD|nr:Na+/H+ antiporter NhaC [[Clostridium] paradoxum JW-YL-7 = DSM 7308]SHL28094.1 Na+:H+ antiporter, NhaC family [[Clostridium] paradoxum JW-YL-7 = DSM 7308]
MSSKPKRKATLTEAIIPILALIIFLSVAVFKYDASPHIPIIGGIIIAGLMATLRLGYSWNELEEGIFKTINMAMQSILILMVVGTIIGTWILSGVVPTMIFYGLQILSPGIFLVATTLICSIVSLSTGSSWTTAGTVGIALLGVGQGLGIPLPIVAGAIISGAYFGDKMSPLSDTTNLAPAMSGASLFEHIRHMIYSTGPSLLISLILYGIVGAKYAGKSLDSNSINEILTALSSNFYISPIMLIPPILVIIIVILKVPALPGLIVGTVAGGLFAFLFQGSSLGEIIDAAHYGFVADTGIQTVDDLLSQGGLDNMMWTVSLILCALTLGGILEKTGMLEVIAESILKLARGTGSLVLVTVFSCIFVNLVTGEQYLAIVIPGRMYKDAYAKKGLHPKNLSRALEDSGTLTSPLIPWNTCGAYMYATLGISPFAYLPFAFLNLINPLISIFYGFTGITMEKLPEKIEETV